MRARESSGDNWAVHLSLKTLVLPSTIPYKIADSPDSESTMASICPLHESGLSPLPMLYNLLGK